MKKIKWGAVGAGVIAGTLALGACGGDPQGSSTAKGAACDGIAISEVGYSPYVNSGGYFPFVEEGMRKTLAKCDIELSTSDPSSDSGKQVSGMENLASAGAKYIVVCPVDPKALSPIAKRLEAQGVTVIGLATSLPEAEVTFNLDDEAFGRLEGEAGAAWAKTHVTDHKPKIAILHQDSGGDPLLARHRGVIAGLDKVLGEGNYDLVSEVEAFEEDTANGAMSTILQAHPDVDLVVGMNDFAALGALSAIKSAGKAPGQDIGIVTGGEDKRVIEAVKAGQVYSTIGLFPESQGQTIASVILKMAAGDKVAREQIVPAKLVTQENVDDVLQAAS